MIIIAIGGLVAVVVFCVAIFYKPLPPIPDDRIEKRFLAIEDLLFKAVQRSETAEFLAHSAKMELVKNQKPQILKVILYRGRLKPKVKDDEIVKKIKDQLKDLS